MMGALGQRIFPNAEEAERQRLALRASRGLLVAMGVVSFVLALDPPELVGLFAQMGIYGLVAASVAPFVFGREVVVYGAAATSTPRLRDRGRW